MPEKAIKDILRRSASLLDEEVEENEAKMDQYVTKLRNLIPYTKTCNIPESSENKYLARCIRARRYNIEAAAKQIRKAAIFRDGIPDLREKAYPKKYKGIFESLVSVFQMRSEGRHVLYVRVGKWDPAEFSWHEFLVMLFLILDEMVSSVETQLFGLMIIIDLKGFGWKHVSSIDVRGLQMIVSLVQECFPARFKGFHVINNPALAQVIYAILKPLLKAKVRERIVFLGYSYQNSLLDIYGSDALPEYLGGDVPNDKCFDINVFSNMYRKNDLYQLAWSYHLKD